MPLSQALPTRSPRIRFGPFELDTRAGELHKGNECIRLQEQCFQILSLLLARPGEVVTREELRARLWPQGTIVDFEHSVNAAIKRLREALGDSAENPQFIETIPRRGYRFLENAKLEAPVAAPQAHGSWLRSKWKEVGAMVLAVALLATAAFFIYTRPKALTDKDEILLADVVNATGEPIFDGTLRTAIAVKLGESPFLNTVSDTRALNALKLMNKPEGEKLVGAVAREACQRLNVKALLNSSIAHLGSDYVITLEALNCQTGDVLTREQTAARSQGELLNALGQATSKVRRTLGESMKSIQRFDTPLEQATTASLPALQAFSLGFQQINSGGWGNLQAIRSCERAVELDPNFALAYEVLGLALSNIGELERSRTYATKAFALRDRASEREKYQITAWYYGSKGELDKALVTLQLYKQSYPRDPIPYNTLGEIYLYALGSPDKALAENRKALELAPDSTTMYGNLAWNLVAMNQFDEAAAVLERAAQRNLSATFVNHTRYALAFVRRDSNAMAYWAEKTTGSVIMLFLEAQAKAFEGRSREANSLYGQAVKLGRAAGLKQLTDLMLEQQALVGAEFGNVAEARAILRQSPGQSGLAAIVLARTGNTEAAQAIARQRAKQFPAGTVVKNVELPLIHAAVALHHGRAAEAVDAIQPAVPHELAAIWCPWWVGCNPNVLYLVSEAYLAQGDAAQATAAFQKILDHHGIYATSPLYPLAYVGLARARKLAGDTPGASKAYEQFFSTWKDADPDVPILRQAKVEYANLGRGGR